MEHNQARREAYYAEKVRTDCQCWDCTEEARANVMDYLKHDLGYTAQQAFAMTRDYMRKVGN